MPPVTSELRKEKAPPSREATRAKRRENKARREELEIDVIEHRVADSQRRCPTCGGTELKPLGTGKQTVVYEYIPAKLVKQIHVQETLACKCGRGVVTAEGAPKAIEKGQYGPGLIAHVVTAKCADSMPLYRQAKSLQRAGIPIARTTLGDLFHSAADATLPLYQRLLQLISQEELVRADETPMRVLDEGHTRRGYLWTFRTEALVGFRFSPTRSGEMPREVLGDSRGYLLVDGYTGYNAVTVPSGRIRAGCWAHARRKFFDAKATAPEAETALELIRALYRVEETAQTLGIVGTGEHTAFRWKESAPILRRLESWMAQETPRHPPKSPLGEALRYAKAQWEALTRFLETARLPLDNNASERALRPAALGRKNYLFVGDDEAGENMAGLYSLVATCEANGVNPQAYLADVLPRLQTHPNSRLDELLPHRWCPALAANTS
jgi:transposase